MNARGSEKGSRRHLRFWGPDVRADVDDEMECHIACLTEELIARGLSRQQAHAQALEQFGDRASAARECQTIGVQRLRRKRRADWYDAILQDLRFAARSLRRTPAFTAVVVMALGLGIGANAAVFSMVDAAAFRPLPVSDPGGLYAIYGEQGQSKLQSFSYPGLEALNADRGPWTGFAAFAEGPASISADAPANVVWSNMVSANYFGLLGLVPAHGRLIGDADERSAVAVLSHALWKTQFASDPQVVGRTIHSNGYPFTIIGVAPPKFLSTRLFSYAPAVWVPAGVHEQIRPGSEGLLDNPGWSPFTVIGRLPPDASLPTAQAALDRVSATLTQRWPDDFRDWKMTTISNRTAINPFLASPDQLRGIGRIVLGGVALVLLIACADVANLLLARMTVRRGEVAVRQALGAGRTRLIRQFLTESLVLAGLGALAAIPFAQLAIHFSGRLTPPTDFATAYQPMLDNRMLVFNALIALGAGLVFGLAPAVMGSRTNLATVLRYEGRGSTRMGSRLREGLVITQLAVSLLVLVAGGLFVRSLQRARATDPGFRADGAVVFTLDPQLVRGYDEARIRSLYERLERELRALPGVTAVSRASNLPLDGSSSAMTVYAEGIATRADEGEESLYSIVGLDYHAAVGTRVVEGRDFSSADRVRGIEPIIVNQAFAEKLWPGQSALGRRIRTRHPQDGDLAEVVGVTATARYQKLSETPRPAFVFSLDRNAVPRNTVVIRTSVAPAAVYGEVRRIMQNIDGTLPVTGLKTLRDHISVSYSAHEGGAVGATSFGVLALLLAAAGLYGVVSYGVAQRRREIGVRVALGATTRDVVGLVVSSGARLTVIGIGAGVLLTVLAGSAMKGMLYETSARDPIILGSVAFLLTVIALITTTIPAVRAARANPTAALRE